MESGRVTHWQEEGGFGFVRPEWGSADVFVHRHSLQGVDELRVGDRVEFECGKRDRGLYTTVCRVVS